jgi:hypothetical protein
MNSNERLIDPQVGPFSPVEEIRAEIELLENLPKSDDRDDAIARLRQWVADQEAPQQ